jgi:sec-independent protein translocase protein TatC
VGAFVLGMLLTPPDIISQSMLAIPMLLLFEVGIIIASLYNREDKNIEENNYES